MAKPVTKRDLIWGYSASALNIGAGLILLPIVLRYLPPEDVGLWFVFITLASLAQLLEMGFQPTLARNVAYVTAGAPALHKVGLGDASSTNGEIDQALLDTLVASARRIYQGVAVLAALLLLFGGTFYVSTLLTPDQNRTTSLIAWVIFASGYIVTFYYGYINGLLQGRGDVTQANKVIVITRSTLILLGGSSVVVGYGMLGLGFAAMLSAIVGRAVAYRYLYYSYKESNLKKTSEQINVQKEIIKTLWHNASRLGAVQVGAFLIQRGNILIASSMLGLVTAASYGMTVTILMTLSGIASVISQLQVPHMSALQAKGDKRSLSSIYGGILVLSWGAFILGMIVLLAFGSDLLVWIGSETRLLPEPLLLVLGVVLLLEMNHSLAATYLTTTNHIPFLRAALVSGICISTLSLISVQSLGALGLVLSQGIVQLAYNNWKWPRMARTDLGIGWRKLLTLGIRTVLGKLTVPSMN